MGATTVRSWAGSLAGVAVVSLVGKRLGEAALRWGATDDEVGAALPGDDLVPDPQSVSTRAITVNASPVEIFPWLAQLGQGRGGFYSYDWVENLIGLDVHSASRVLAEFQDIRPGTQIRMAPEPPFYGFIVKDVTTPTHLVLEMRIHPFTGRQLPPGARTQTPQVTASWAFVLQPIDDVSTRLITRTRAGLRLPFGLLPAYCTLLEAVEFVMERRMLLGIRDRAEGVTSPRPTLPANVHTSEAGPSVEVR